MSFDLFDLSGKIALVTGAGRGLGLAMAEGLGGTGATLVLNDRVGERLEGAATQLRDKGLEVHTALFDVSDGDAVRGSVAEIEARVGPIHILVNNAGIQDRQPTHAFPEADWQRVLDTNLTGPLLVAQAVVPGMIERRAGKIINIGSIIGLLGRPESAPYAVAKGGLKMLTKVMAVEWAAHGIQVNTIAPGYFATEMTRPFQENTEIDAYIRGHTPAGKWGDPSDLVGTAVYLASTASAFVTGQVIYVDGGYSSTT